MHNNLRISTRILGGFGVILALLLGLAMFAYNESRSLGDLFADYRGETASAAAMDDIRYAARRAELAATAYVAAPGEQTAATLSAELSRLEGGVDLLLTTVAADQSVTANRLHDIADIFVAQARAMQTAVDMRNHRVEAMQALGIEHRRQIGAIQRNLAQRGAEEPAYAALGASEAFLVARMRVDRFLAGGTEADFQEAFAPLDETLVRLDQASTEATMAERADLGRARDGVMAFRDAAEAAQAAEYARREAIDALSAAAAPLIEAVEASRTDAAARQGAMGRSGDNLVTQILRTVLLVAGGALAAGIFLAFVVGRWIGRAISDMAGTMKHLAEGDLDVRIDGAERKTELGEMARSLKVFQSNGRAQREAEAQAERRRAEQERVVRDLTSGLGRLSRGDLTGGIESPADDPFPAEYETLRLTFNELVSSLNTMVLTITESAQGVRSGADEIAQVSQDLSSRAETQAATLEQSAAALNQLTESVRATAEKAAQADRATIENRREAEAGGAVVREAVTAMRQIEKSSEQITRIIGVIDDISFQTNLLALNAGVEAARAGEAGRGFAVVASEVRALAQRASGSAKEIKDLISQSSQQVEEGSALVSRTGSSLEDILRRVSEVSALVSEIAAAATEQAKGLAEVNTGVTQIDVVTQQNAAVAEESTAAASSLLSEAQQLAQALSGFRTSGGKPATPARAAPVTQLRHAPQPQPHPQRAAAAGGGGWEEF
ncbi:methyl-accepting chemotaxis protein [Halodurantibacterium flavum]|uniref:Methyl-accepting chemotaxis protein n=1 Tax=Halodurantibacterium flavum TaxID=1382802 RepID=A0ABW4S4K3_9RHOB